MEALLRELNVYDWLNSDLSLSFKTNTTFGVTYYLNKWKRFVYLAVFMYFDRNKSRAKNYRRVISDSPATTFLFSI